MATPRKLHQANQLRETLLSSGNLRSSVESSSAFSAKPVDAEASRQQAIAARRAEFRRAAIESPTTVK